MMFDIECDSMLFKMKESEINVDVLQTERDTLKTEIGEKDDEIQDLLSLLEEKGEHLSKGNAEIAGLGEELKYKEEEIKSLQESVQKNLSDMEAKEALLNELRNENEQIKANSSSCKVSLEDQTTKDTIKKLCSNIVI